MFADMSTNAGDTAASDESAAATDDFPADPAESGPTHHDAGHTGAETRSDAGAGQVDVTDAGAGDVDDGPASGGGAKGRSDRALIRRVAAKAESLRKAPKDQVRLLAAMLGVDATNNVELTVAVMTADRSAVTVGRGLIELAAMDQMELAVAASSLERSELRKQWAFAAEAGADLGSIPAADAKAALAFARAVADLDKATLDKVAAAIELARKT